MTVTGPDDQVAAALSAVSGVNRLLNQGEGEIPGGGRQWAGCARLLARVVVERGWQLLEMKPQEFTLEDVFINLVTKKPRKKSHD